MLVSVTGPMDLTRFYLTPQVGIGQRLRLETIDRRLAGLPLRPVLYLLSQIAALADQSINDRSKAIDLIRRVFPNSIIDRSLAGVNNNSTAAPMSSQTVLNLANRALVYCRDTDGDTGERLTRELGGLLLGLADHTSRDDHADRSLQLELIRLALYFQLNDLSGWYEVANLLLFDVLPTMTDDRDWVDSAAVVRTAYGLDLELFWALTAAYGIAAREDAKSFELPRPFVGGVVSEEDMARWAHVWLIDIDTARERAVADVQSGSWWMFNAFFDRPLLGLRGGSGVTARPAFLANKATPMGMFWAIRNAFVAGGGGHQQWAQFFGRAVESLGRRYVDDYLSGIELLRDETAIREAWGPGKACDLVLLGRDWVAIDFVHHQITRATATTGDFDQLLTDVRRAATDKLVQQVDESLRRGIVAGGSPAAMFPVVVVGSPFPIQPLLYAEIRRDIASRSPAVIGVDDRCRPPAIMDLNEFSALVQVSQR